MLVFWGEINLESLSFKEEFSQLESIPRVNLGKFYPIFVLVFVKCFSTEAKKPMELFQHLAKPV